MLRLQNKTLLHLKKHPLLHIPLFCCRLILDLVTKGLDLVTKGYLGNSTAFYWLPGYPHPSHVAGLFWTWLPGTSTALYWLPTPFTCCKLILDLHSHFYLFGNACYYERSEEKSISDNCHPYIATFILGQICWECLLLWTIRTKVNFRKSIFMVRGETKTGALVSYRLLPMQGFLRVFSRRQQSKRVSSLCCWMTFDLTFLHREC